MTDYIEHFLFGFPAILIISIVVLLVFPVQGSVLAEATYHYYCMNEQGLLVDRFIGMTEYEANAPITVSARDRAGIPVSLTLYAEAGVKVPDLYGMTEGEAKAAIIAAGLSYGGATDGKRAEEPSDSGRVFAVNYVAEAILGDGYVKPAPR